MLESKGRQGRLPCRYCWKKSPQYFQVWNLELHHELPANACINLKYQQLPIVWTIIISTIEGFHKQDQAEKFWHLWSRSSGLILDLFLLDIWFRKPISRFAMPTVQLETRSQVPTTITLRSSALIWLKQSKISKNSLWLSGSTCYQALRSVLFRMKWWQYLSLLISLFDVLRCRIFGDAAFGISN